MKTIATLPVLCCGPDTQPLDEVESESLAARFKALADPTRVAIVNRLAACDECCVCDLNDVFDLSQPTISHHLKVLRDAGFATVRPNGARRLYAVNYAPLQDMDAWLDRFRRFWTPHLDALATELMRGQRERRLHDSDERRNP